MSVETIKEHMNSHHIKEMIELVKKYANLDCKTPILKDVNEGGMSIEADGQAIFIPFPAKASEAEYKQAIINLCLDIKSSPTDIKNDIAGFINEFNSIILSTLNNENEVASTYAPLLRDGDNFYIYVSEVAEHYSNIRDNPTNIEIMFLEDESKAKSVIVRKRLRYRVKATFVERGEDFDRIYDNFIERVGKSGGVGQIRNMLDFHLIKLELGKGRFVKGFGQAYDLEGQDVKPALTKMPHNIKKHG